MQYINLVADGVANNSIFDLDHPSNRDNCNLPFHQLRNELMAVGVEIATADLLVGKVAALTLHLNTRQDVSYTNRDVVVLFETSNVIPSNCDMNNIAKAALVFTWDDDLVARYSNFRKINFPNNFDVKVNVNGFSKRDILFSMISGNKSLSIESEYQNLYKERVKVIRWFEKNHPDDFRLYGTGWNAPQATKGLVNRLIRKLYALFLCRYFNVKPFPSYCGVVKNKSDVYARTRFSFCFENVAGYNGYITEKIFDCFFSGCVPIYWGAGNIERYISKECFVDIRDFVNLDELYKFLISMDELEYMKYQQAISDFIEADSAFQFGSTCFVSTIKSALMNLLGRL